MSQWNDVVDAKRLAVRARCEIEMLVYVVWLGKIMKCQIDMDKIFNCVNTSQKTLGLHHLRWILKLPGPPLSKTNDKLGFAGY